MTAPMLGTTSRCSTDAPTSKNPEILTPTGLAVPSGVITQTIGSSPRTFITIVVVPAHQRCLVAVTRCPECGSYGGTTRIFFNRATRDSCQFSVVRLSFPFLFRPCNGFTDIICGKSQRARRFRSPTGPNSHSRSTEQ